MRRLYWILPIILVLVLVGARLAQKRAAAIAQAAQRAMRTKAAPPVVAVPARVEDIVHRFEYVGSVEAPLSVNIAPKVTGRIIYLQAHEGDRVTRGQVLVRIDPSDVEAQVRQQQATLAEAQYRLAQAQLTQNSTNVGVSSQIGQQQAAVASAEADLKSARANLANADTRYQRLSQLFAKGYIAAQDVDDARAARGVQQAAVEAAQSRVKQARAALAMATANIAQGPAYEQSLAALGAQVAAARAGLESAESKRNDTVLTSPLDGFVTGRYMDPGAVASPGQSVLAVQYMREVWVNVPIPEEVSASVRVGMPAEVTLDALPGAAFSGQVTQLNPSADPQSRQFAARVTLENADNRVRPGTYAHVALETDRVRGALVVPREAIQRGREEGVYVVVVDSVGVSHHRPVTLGAAGTDLVAVTHGLSVGEKVVVMSAMPLKDKQRVSLGGRSGGSPGRGGSRAGGESRGK